MKKSTHERRTFRPLVLIMISIFFFTGALSAGLMEAYKSGRIVINNQPGYGEKNDWAELLYTNYHRMGAATAGGKNVAGFSDKPVLYVYSPEGKRLYDINLKIKPIPVTSETIADYKKRLVDTVKRKYGGDKRTKHLVKIYADLPYKTMFGKTMVYYYWFLTDSEGNILVFHYKAEDKEKIPGFSRSIHRTEIIYVKPFWISVNTKLKI